MISEIDGKIIDTTNSDASVLDDLWLPDEASELTQSTIDIAVDTTMDYNEIATAINAQTKLTNIHAEPVSTGKDQYKFVLTAQDTGRVINPTTSTTTVLTDLGLETESGNLTDISTLQTKIKYKGVEVVSNTNKFELFSGLEVDVLKVETNNKFTVSIGPPIDLIADELEEFVKGMNLALSNLRMRMDSTNEESHM